MYIRHTMGQDQAKPAPWNPPGSPKIPFTAVQAVAAKVGVEVKREGLQRMVYIREPGDVWRTFRVTNFLAWEALQARLTAARNKSPLQTART